VVNNFKASLAIVINTKFSGAIDKSMPSLDKKFFEQEVLSVIAEGA